MPHQRRALRTAAGVLTAAGVGVGVGPITAADGASAPAQATTRRVSVATDGTQANTDVLDPAISGDGRYVAFVSRSPRLVAADTNGATDVFVRDRLRHTTRRASVASDGRQARRFSLAPAISADGRYIAFHSMAPNLVGRDTNQNYDVFVRDQRPR